MKRESRLQSARAWIAKYEGKNIVKSYSNWYGVDLLCAIKELRRLGIPIHEEREKQIRATLLGRSRARQRRKILQQQETEQLYPDFSDETFAFIAGHTSGWLPYGTTWEEINRQRTDIDTFGKKVISVVRSRATMVDQ